MSATLDFLAEILSDRQISDEEVQEIRRRLPSADGWDLESVKQLVELYCNARAYSPAFEDLFFEVLERVFLADGEIQLSEQYYLLKILYSDHRITQREREFLETLRNRAAVHSPEFDALCRDALAAPATNWEVGGR